MPDFVDDDVTLPEKEDVPGQPAGPDVYSWRAADYVNVTDALYSLRAHLPSVSAIMLRNEDFDPEKTNASATFADFGHPGMSFNQRREGQVGVVAHLTATLVCAAAGVVAFRIVYGGMNSPELCYTFTATGDTYVPVSMQFLMDLSGIEPGNKTVKLQWRRVSGSQPIRLDASCNLSLVVR